MIKRPLLVLAAAYILGILCGTWSQLLFWVSASILILIFFFFILPASKVKILNPYDLFLVFVPVIFTAGLLQVKTQTESCPLEEAYAGRTITVEGIVKENQEHDSYHTMRLSGLVINDSEEECNQDLLLTCSIPCDITVSSKILVTGKCRSFSRARNPGQFDEYAYQKAYGYCMKVKAEKIIVLQKTRSGLKQYLYRIQKRLTGLYEKLLPEQEAGILNALLLGDRSQLSDEIKELYQNSGISHILAISGLHLSLFGMGLFQFLRLMKRSILCSIIISFSVLLGYGIMAGFGISVQRALIMFFLTLLARKIGCTSDLLSSLSLASILVLWEQPLLLYQAGFLLSFGAVFGIAAVQPILEHCIPTEACLENKLLKLLLPGLAIQLVTAPVLLYFFFEISPYTLLLNLIVLPLMSFLIPAGLAAGMAGSIQLFFGVPFAGCAYFILKLYEFFCNLVQKLPLAVVTVGKPDFFMIAAYYLIALAVLFLIYFTKKRISLFLCLLLLLPFFSRSKDGLTVVFLDVGQGDCAFIEDNHGVTMLVDGGSLSEQEVGKKRIEPFLKARGIKQLDYAFLSHADLDHTNGIIELLEKGVIRHLVLPRTQDCEEVFSDVIQTAQRVGTKVMFFGKGSSITGERWIMKCLYPEPGNGSAGDNASSMVLRLTSGQICFFFTGDLEGEGEDNIVQQLSGIGNELEKSYVILKTAHHGSRNSTGSRFLNIIQPEAAIISCGEANSYGHPHKELLERLQETECQLYMTMERGAIQVKTDGTQVIFEPYLMYQESFTSK